MSPTLLVKVCGITDSTTARVALAAGADFLGLVLAPSPRRMEPVRARALVREVPAAWVGVFVDPAAGEVEALADELGLAAIQLHGRETPAFCRALGRATGRPVWKAIRWRGEPAEMDPWAGMIERVLLDSGAGEGRALPWTEIAERLPPERRPAPLFLAGGLDPDNVAAAVAVVAPDGVDASSRLEASTGRKDPERIRAFVAAARAAALPAPG